MIQIKSIIILVLTFTFVPLLNGVQAVDIFEVPSSVEFAGKTIALSRYDMKERFDREQMNFAYGHAQTVLIFKRANRYFPIIEPILKANGIPDDFKYLAVVESNLDLRAMSQVKAAGFWQLMPVTAQEFGLEVNDEVDERYHIEKSTVAACKYLKRAYDKYNDWTMVAASYNGGMGRISKESDKQLADNFFDILLTPETSRYVFRILAIKRIMENPKLYGYIFKKECFYDNLSIKKDTVRGAVDDWATWAKNKGLNYFLLKDHNVWLRERKLTNPNNKTYLIDIVQLKDTIDKEIKIHNNQWITN
jgi:membrane-bound lytic murein transglycosylase D